ncbi:MAG: Outer membrane protein II* [Candidatus Accumulibacter regalis]|uniref:Outer membrane protein II n=4 Tax=Candidatus Accumulibacter TaxID=327159 RepID=A0A011QKM7_ACCRE|nr:MULTISPECIES: OmpA family protein [unclassified Candidatus Accumulibacter]EXI89540.1 MAG: Outer membrane protein II* [Candidatus Accumulibacter regalis]MBN8512915.1 OmpA family protein [Accumulibacter sp.]HRE69937.1 OmpA family protein [Accumulibacter sp.]HRI92647.1 OmpA family protein [Accumulibacter sp.]
MKSKIITTLLASIGLFAAVGAAQAQTAADRVYVIDSRGEVAMSGAGLCWRTGFWTPAAAAKDPAGCKCDKDLLPKEVCEPPMAKAAAATAKPSGDKVTVAADALFDFNKATLRPAGKAKLDEVVAMSKQIKLEVIIAVGHTDRIGSDAYNQKLSERRAASVKAYLVSKGVEANRVYTEGKGEKQPVTQPGQCPGGKSAKVIECLQPDRRVDIELIGTK